MQPQPDNNHVPWQERAFVSVQEAAQILARSPARVRGAVAAGALEAVRFKPNSAPLITVPSLLRMIARAEPVPEAVTRNWRKAHLTLAVNNDATA